MEFHKWSLWARPDSGTHHIHVYFLFRGPEPVTTLYLTAREAGKRGLAVYPGLQENLEFSAIAESTTEDRLCSKFMAIQEKRGACTSCTRRSAPCFLLPHELYVIIFILQKNKGRCRVF